MTSPPSTFAVARPSSLAPSSTCLRHPLRSRLNCIAKKNGRRRGVPISCPRGLLPPVFMRLGSILLSTMEQLRNRRRIVERNLSNGSLLARHGPRNLSFECAHAENTLHIIFCHLLPHLCCRRYHEPKPLTVPLQLRGEMVLSAVANPLTPAQSSLVPCGKRLQILHRIVFGHFAVL